MDNTTVAMGGGGCRPMFTALQWQELEHQALIFKYMMAGIPVPPDLLLPIRKSFEAMAARFYHHPTMGYCSLYGKKVDPEPGRCRRTDGKKWRCSKDAYPDSKYCERHMHRGRNRSRKLVETQTLFQSHSQSSSSTVTNSTSNDRCNVVSGGTRESFPRSIPVQSIAASHAQTSDSGPNLTQLQMDRGSYSVMDRKDYRYLNVVKSEKDEHSIFSGATSANPRGLGIDPSTDNTWHMIPSQVDLFPLSKGRNESIMPINNTQLHSLHGLEQDPMNSLSRQHQHCLFGNEFGCTDGIKQENQSLQLFFDEWPKARDSWSELKHERSNRTSFSTTQLSMSIPMASSDFSTTSSRSPNGTQPSSILKKIDE